MRVYMHPFSQHSRRVLMLCDELGLDVERVPVALEKGEHTSEAYASKSVTGLVPVMEDGDFTLAESHAIMRYLANRADAQSLYPREPRKQAQIDMWLDWNHTILNPPIQTMVIELLFKGENADEASVAAAREKATRALQVLERARTRQPVLQDEPSIADLAIGTTIALYEMVGGDLSKTPSVAAWYETFKKRPSFARTAPPPLPAAAN